MGYCDEIVIFSGDVHGLDIMPELSEWFSVPGDVDDFIFFGEDAACSER